MEEDETPVLTGSTNPVQNDWHDFQRRLADGDVEYVDLDDFDAPEDSADVPLPEDQSHPFALDLTTIHPLAGYDEHASAAIKTLNKEMTRIGAENLGAVGNTSHLYGYHLSPNRLRGTGHSDDYSLSGSANTPIVDQKAACAQDIGMSWKASRQWIKWLFTQYSAGKMPHVVEIIGSIDGNVALYAATSTNRKTVRYTGTGHVAWSHVAHGRRYASVLTYGKEILGSWTATSPITQKTEVPELRSVVGACTLPSGEDVAAVVGTDFQIYLSINGGPFATVNTGTQRFDPGLSMCPDGGNGVVIMATESHNAVIPVHVKDVHADPPRAAVVPPAALPGSTKCEGAPGVARMADGNYRMTLVGTDTEHNVWRAKSTSVDVNGVIQWTGFSEDPGRGAV